MYTTFISLIILLFQAIAAEREAADKENVISKAPWRKMLQLSKPDWWLLLTGLVGFALFGVLLSALYVLFSEAIEVLTCHLNLGLF